MAGRAWRLNAEEDVSQDPRRVRMRVGQKQWKKQVDYDVQKDTTYHESPIASMLDASSHTATFVASDTQYAT